MSQYDPDPPTERVVVSQPVYTETVVVRPEGGSGWLLAGGLAALVLVAIAGVFVLSISENDDEVVLAEAQAQILEAEARADRAVMQAQIAKSEQGVDLARADAARAQAEAASAVSEAQIARSTADRDVVVVSPAGN